MTEKFDSKDEYEVCLVQGHLFLFSNSRIDRNTVPEGLYVYDVADAEGDGCFARIQPFVMVDHWGTIIGREPLELRENGCYYPKYGSDEYEGWFVDVMNLEEFLEADPAEFDSEPSADGEIFLSCGNFYNISFSVCNFPDREEDVMAGVAKVLADNNIVFSGLEARTDQNNNGYRHIVPAANSSTEVYHVKVRITHASVMNGQGIRTFALKDRFVCWLDEEFGTDVYAYVEDFFCTPCVDKKTQSGC